MDVKIPSLNLDYVSDKEQWEYHDAGPAAQGDEVVDIADTAKETVVSIDVSVLYKTGNSAVYREIFTLLERYMFGDLELPVQARAGTTPNSDQIARAQQMIDRIITKYIPIDAIVDAVWEDIALYGSAFVEWTLGTMPEEGFIGPLVFAHREAFSFNVTPAGKTDTDYLIGSILKGVLQNKTTKEMEYWQTPDPDKSTTNILIKHNEENHGLIHFREFRGGDPGGRSYVAPIVEHGYDLALARRRMMQADNRAAGAFMAVKLRPDELLGKEQLILGSKNGASIGAYYEKIKAHSKKVVQKWSTTTSTLLYPGEELISPSVQIALDPVMVHKYIETGIIKHFIPRHVLETEGNSLTSTGQSILDLMSKIAKGWRSVIAHHLIKFFNMVLEKNGFTDLEVTCKWPQIQPDDKEMAYSQALSALEQAVIPPSRFLSMVGWPQLSDEEKSELEEYWQLRQANGVV